MKRFQATKNPTESRVFSFNETLLEILSLFNCIFDSVVGQLFPARLIEINVEGLESEVSTVSKGCVVRNAGAGVLWKWNSCFCWLAVPGRARSHGKWLNGKRSWRAQRDVPIKLRWNAFEDVLCWNRCKASIQAEPEKENVRKQATFTAVIDGRRWLNRDPAQPITSQALALIEPSTRRSRQDLIDRDNAENLIEDVLNCKAMPTRRLHSIATRQCHQGFALAFLNATPGCRKS